MNAGTTPCTDPARRSDLSRMTSTERLITQAMSAIEIMAADPRLTDAVSLLAAARFRLADYLDGVPGIATHPLQHLEPAIRTALASKEEVGRG